MHATTMYNYTFLSHSMYAALRRKRCGSCDGCRSNDCGDCHFCRDMVRFGGKGTLKQCCEKRKCTNIQLSKKPAVRTGYIYYIIFPLTYLSILSGEKSMEISTDPEIAGMHASETCLIGPKYSPPDQMYIMWSFVPS